jgi:hypothetical protein
MKAMIAVGFILGLLAVFTLGSGAGGTDTSRGLSFAPPIVRINLAIGADDILVVHAIWKRPRWVAPEDVLRDEKIWI